MTSYGVLTGIFVLLLVLGTVTIVSASMLSSRISRDEERLYGDDMYLDD